MVLVEISLNPPSQVMLTFVPPEAVLEKNKKNENLSIEEIMKNPQKAISVFIPSVPQKDQLGFRFLIGLNDFIESKYTIGQVHEIKV